MANERLFLCHKLLPRQALCIAKRLGEEFYVPNITEAEVNTFHEDVYNAFLDEGGAGHYDDGYSVETETSMCAATAARLRAEGKL